MQEQRVELPLVHDSSAWWGGRGHQSVQVVEAIGRRPAYVRVCSQSGRRRQLIA